MFICLLPKELARMLFTQKFRVFFRKNLTLIAFNYIINLLTEFSVKVIIVFMMLNYFSIYEYLLTSCVTQCLDISVITIHSI